MLGRASEGNFHIQKLQIMSVFFGIKDSHYRGRTVLKIGPKKKNKTRVINV